MVPASVLVNDDDHQGCAILRRVVATQKLPHVGDVEAYDVWMVVAVDILDPGFEMFRMSWQVRIVQCLRHETIEVKGGEEVQ
jgi:hypothetical protein